MGQTRPHPPVPPFQAGRQRRVLVVDDDVMLAETLSGFLSRFHQVEVCWTAADAMERLSSAESWDVILCDLNLPDSTGIDLWQEASRRRPELAGHFVFMSGSGVDDPGCGLADVPNPRLGKPVDIRRLLDVIASS